MSTTVLSIYAMLALFAYKYLRIASLLSKLLLVLVVVVVMMGVVVVSKELVKYKSVLATNSLNFRMVRVMPFKHCSHSTKDGTLGTSLFNL